MLNNTTPQQAHEILNEYISLDSDLDNEFINALRVADKALLACGEINELEKDTRKSIYNDNSEKEYNLGYYQAIRDVLKLIR